eukprot:IDg18806t1
MLPKAVRLGLIPGPCCARLEQETEIFAAIVRCPNKHSAYTLLTGNLLSWRRKRYGKNSSQRTMESSSRTIATGRSTALFAFAMLTRMGSTYEDSLVEKTDRMSVRRRSGTMVAGPLSAQEILSTVSRLPRASTETQFVSGTVGVVNSVTRRASCDPSELLIRIKVEISDIKRRSDESIELLASINEQTES